MRANDHCPTCGQPLHPLAVVARVGVVRFCADLCVAEWFRRHNRRTRTVPVTVDRRRPAEIAAVAS